MADDAGPILPKREVFDFAANRKAQEADPEAAWSRARRWAEQNAESIASLNSYVEKYGTLAEDLASE